MRKRQFDRDQIIRMDQEGFTPFEIRDAIGAKSTYHIREILRQHKRKIGLLPPAKEKPGVHPEPSPVPLDVKKVQALQKAGWPIDKIWDEFGGRYPISEIRKAMGS